MTQSQLWVQAEGLLFCSQQLVAQAPLLNFVDCLDLYASNVVLSQKTGGSSGLKEANDAQVQCGTQFLILLSLKSLPFLLLQKKKAKEHLLYPSF